MKIYVGQKTDGSDAIEIKPGAVIPLGKPIVVSAGEYPDNNPKTQFGVLKVPLHLVPPISTAYEAWAFADGANKYGPYNWREKKISTSVYIAAAKRHLDAYWDGEDFAPDSGVHHLAHAKACLGMLIDGISIGFLNDDRPPKGGFPKFLAEYNKK